MTIKIELPKQKIDNEVLESRIKKSLTDDFEKKEGLLSKCLVFIKLYAPMSITDLQTELFKYFKKNIERVNVFRACDELEKWGLITKTTMGDMMLISEQEKEPKHRHAEAKHRQFLQKISPQLRIRYNNRNYVWINKFGDKFLEWACKLNGFNIKEDGKK